MNSKVIVRNSLWQGLETGVGVVSGILTSIAIARTLGPEKLGHFTYIAWLLGVTSTLSNLGIPSATNKYMAEYLGRGAGPIAKAIFFLALRFQTAIAFVVTILAMTISWFGVDPNMRWTAVILAASIFPGMVITIPSYANMANEDLGANVPAALVSNAIYIIGVVFTLLFYPDTFGLAVTILAMKSAELAIRIVPVMRWMKSIPHGVVPEEARLRFFAYSRQSLVLLLLSVVVWDRSEVVVLRYFSDIRQLAFYTVVFNVTERLRVLPQTLTTATGATMFAQFGRDPARLNSLLATTVRFLLVVAVPINVGIALLSKPVITLTYGAKYLEAIPLLAVASLLGLPRVILAPVNGLLAAADRQSITVRLNMYMAVVNLGLDIALIPKFGAMGAVIANGVSQALAAIALSWLAGSSLKLKWEFLDFAKMAGVSVAMSVAVLALPTTGSAFANLVAGIGVGAAAFLLALRIAKVLDNEDGRRLMRVAARFPSAIRKAVSCLVDLLIPSLDAA